MYKINETINFIKHKIVTLLAPSLKTAFLIFVVLTGSFTAQIQAAPARKRQQAKFTTNKMRAHVTPQAQKIKAQKNIPAKAKPMRATPDEAKQRRVMARKAQPRQLAAKNAQLAIQRKKQIQADAQLAQRLQTHQEQAAHNQQNRKTAIRAMAAKQIHKNRANNSRQPNQPVQQTHQRRQATRPKRDMSPPHVSQFQNPPSRHDQYSCGAAAVQMALKMLARQNIIDATEVPTFDELVDILQIRKNKCAYSNDITRYLRQELHLNCIAMHQHNGRIIDNLDTIIKNSRTIPTIALSYYDKKRSEKFGHFVLLWDTGEDDRYVTICDPSETRQKISSIPRNAFMQTCNAIIQITGKKYQN